MRMHSRSKGLPAFSMAEKNLYALSKRKACHHGAPYGSMTVVRDKHKRGVFIGADESENWPFASLKLYGLETEPLGEARQYE